MRPIRPNPLMATLIICSFSYRAPDSFCDVFRGEAEVLEEVARRGGLAEAVHADHRALESDVLAPIVADAGLDRYLWELRRQHGVPVGRVLAVENARRRHRDEPHGDPGLREQLLG